MFVTTEYNAIFALAIKLYNYFGEIAQSVRAQDS